jgi:hypothetical protein
MPGRGRNFLDVTIRGDAEVKRALDKLPRQATREVKDGSEKLARLLANLIRASGRASDKQSARASRTVRTKRGVTPKVIAGPHPLLLGSEFGVVARFGWYRKGRYHASPARQFRGRRPTGYWFFPVVTRERATIRAAHQEMVDAVIRDWSA